MEAKFLVTQLIKEYVNMGENWDYVEVRQKYKCANYHDLQNLILTIVESSMGSVKFQIYKEEVAE